MSHGSLSPATALILAALIRDQLASGASAQPETVSHAGTPLTSRESEVLALIAAGLTARAIAHRLRISTGTVRKHIEHIYDKTGHHDRLLAVLHARRAGLIEPEPANTMLPVTG